MSSEIPMAETNRMKPAGWTGSTMPVKRKYLSAMRPDIGRKASTDEGLSKKG